MKERNNGWGGAREGAGRPKNANGARKQHQVRAYNDEWEIVRAFIKIMRVDREAAEQFIKKHSIEQ